MIGSGNTRSQYLATGGDTNPVDGNGTPITEYIKLFGDFNLDDFSGLDPRLVAALPVGFVDYFTTNREDTNIVYTIEGGDGRDVLIGFSGQDIILSKGGDDVVYFNAEDFTASGQLSIYGGSGFDVAVFGTPGINTETAAPDYRAIIHVGAIDRETISLEIDVALQDIEVIFAGTGSDIISTNNISIRLIAGLGGDDVITIRGVSGAIGAPTVIWGGGGADSIYIQKALSETASPGILVVNAPGVTEENFHLFDIEALGLGDNFDWTKIDAVILNPDAADKVFVNGVLLESGSQNVDIFDVTPNVYNPDPLDPLDWNFASLGSFDVGNAWLGGQSYISANMMFNNLPQVIREIGVPGNFLNYSGAIVAPISSFRGGFVLEMRDPVLGTYITAAYAADADLTDDVPDDPIPLVIGPYTIGMADDYDLSGATAVGEWRDEWGGTPESGYGFRLHYFDFEWSTGPFDDTPDGFVPWFIVGGGLQGTLLTGGINFVMPLPDEEESGSSGGGGSGSGGPRGGSFGNALLSSNLNSGDGGWRLSDFDPTIQTVVVNGVALSAATLVSGITTTEANSSTVIRYGEDDFVVLRGVSLANWQSGSAGQILGGIGNDVLTGTSASNVFAGGAGNDTITAGAGNDRINYTSGNDVINSNSMINTGVDVLDLSRFLDADIRFTIVGESVQIFTSDGTITLENQVQGLVGSSTSNIESVLLQIGSLDEAAIRERGLIDQTTSGNDTIQGTNGSETLDGGTGDDTLVGRLGDDTYIVDSAGDQVVETVGAGSDTIISRVAWTLSSDSENLTLVGTQNLSGTGNSSNNIIFGNDGSNDLSGQNGNDTLYGEAGNDSLNGDSGTDWMYGGLGDDTYLVNVVVEIAVESASAGNDTVRSTVTWALGDNFENLVLGGTTALNGTGNAKANVLTGNNAVNSLLGLDGNDEMFGGQGNDFLFGGSGNDTLNGGVGSDSMTGGLGDDIYIIEIATDILTEFAAEGRDLVQGAQAWTLGANFEDHLLICTQN